MAVWMFVHDTLAPVIYLVALDFVLWLLVVFIRDIDMSACFYAVQVQGTFGK
jgi:hypothetical protein